LWSYLERNAGRLDYKLFLENGWPIGSGGIESAHKWVLHKRMKQPGMRWSRENARKMACARALYASVGCYDFAELLERANAN